MSVGRPPIGLCPAAGRGVRFGSSGYSKELFPLLLEAPEDGDFAPHPIGELALRAIRAAGAERCVAVISRDKGELVRVLGAGLPGLSLGYVVQPEPRGLPHAIACARAWLGDSDVVFAMPDTVFLPGAALADVHARRIASGADLMLGVFPVDEPGRLGPVETSPDGAVTRVHDKPGETPHKNTWGIAGWTPRFTAFCCDWAEAAWARDPGRELVLGHAFEAARQEGLSVRAVEFAAGSFLDIGTPRGLRAALGALATHGVVLAGQAAGARGHGGP